MKTVFLRKFSKDLDKIDLKHVLNDIAEVIIHIEKAKALTEISNLKN